MGLNLDLNRDHFSLFGLPVSYTIDLAELGSCYRELQRQFHPDRFVAKPEREQLLAVQYASLVNEAYETLKSPLLRARYLLELSGRANNSETTTIRDEEFLMQQIDLREQMSEIEDADIPFERCNELENKVETELQAQQELFQQEYPDGDLEKAENAVDKMQFFGNLLSQLESIEDSLSD